MKDICLCDVEDKEKLALFRNRISNWKKILNGKDQHSIFNQVQGIIWDDTVYRSFNEALRVSQETSAPSTGRAGTTTDLIHRSFFISQVMALRRITDKHEYNPFRSVYSLNRLIYEIEENHPLFTRENYVCYDGSTYENKDNTTLRQERIITNRHKTFDNLSDKTENNRTRKDIIRKQIFTELKKQLKTTEKVKKYANKYVAHASDPCNREKIAQSLKDLSLNHLVSCYKTIIQVSIKIGFIIDEYIVIEVAVPQYDQFENWDKPILTTKDKENLHAYWLKRTELFRNMADMS